MTASRRSRRDAGRFTPRGFSISLSDAQLEAVRPWTKLLQPYGAYEFEQGGGGSDVSPMKPVLGAVNMAAWIYLAGKYGFGPQ